MWNHVACDSHDILHFILLCLFCHFFSPSFFLCFIPLVAGGLFCKLDNRKPGGKGRKGRRRIKREREKRKKRQGSRKEKNSKEKKKTKVAQVMVR